MDLPEQLAKMQVLLQELSSHSPAHDHNCTATFTPMLIQEDTLPLIALGHGLSLEKNTQGLTPAIKISSLVKTYFARVCNPLDRAGPTDHPNHKGPASACRRGLETKFRGQGPASVTALETWSNPAGRTSL